jgi:hypothetical protein
MSGYAEEIRMVVNRRNHIRTRSVASRALVLVAMALAPAAALAADIPVAPGQSIQNAINAAQAGDRVLVQPGTYLEAIVFQGLPIEVIGVGGPSVTTIDASGLNTSTVTFGNGEPSGTLLRGFTITGGKGQQAGAEFGGGGILILAGAQSLVRECRIVDNSLAQRGGGAGVLALGNVTLIDSVIANNGGRGVEGRVALTRCSVLGNADGGVLGRGSLVMTDCLIANNVTSGAGGGVANSTGTVPVTIERCVFRGNQAQTGGGISFSSLFGFFGPSTVSRCMFVDNIAQEGGGIYMAVLTDGPFGGSAAVRQCTFEGNFGAIGAAASLYVSGTSGSTAAIFEHCSISSNIGPGLFANADQLLVRDSIIWNQPTPFTSTGSITVSTSNVEGGYPGTGNFNLDPRFVDSGFGDLRLAADSPCIDAGVWSLSTDVEGDPQIGSPDVGADEFHPHLRLMGVPAAGNSVVLSVIGPPASPLVFLFTSLELAPAPVPSPYGNFLLGPLVPLIVAFPPLPANGYIGVPITLPAGLPAVSLHMQAFIGTSPGSGKFTNAESIRLE